MILMTCAVAYFGFLLLTSGAVFFMTILVPFLPVSTNSRDDPGIPVYLLTRFLNNFSIGNSMAPALTVVFDISYAICNLICYTFFVLTTVFISTLGHFLDIMVRLLPFFWRIFKLVFSFVCWTIYHLIKGIFGSDCQFLRCLSWVVVFCTTYLYIENRVQENGIGGHRNNQTNNNRNSTRNLNTETRAERQYHERNIDEEIDRGRAYNDQNRNVRDPDQNENENQNINSQVPNVPNNRELNNNGQVLVNNFVENNTNGRDIQNFNRNLQILHQNAMEENELNEARDENEANQTQEQGRQLETQIFNDYDHGLRNRHTNEQANLEQRLCIVCMEEERNTVLFPCGHTHFCQNCVFTIARRNQTCPICQTFIQEHRRIYL